MIDFKKPAARGAYDWIAKPTLEPEVREPIPPVAPPPEPPRRPAPIHITIDLTGVPMAAPRARYSPLNRLIGIVLALLLISLLVGCAAAAHADEWNDGQRQDSGDWSASTYRPHGSRNTYTEFHGPNGETRHCTSFRMQGGDTTYTDCGR
jgi:hypothetical protein